MYILIGFGCNKVVPQILFVGTNKNFPFLKKTGVVVMKDKKDRAYYVFNEEDYEELTIYNVPSQLWTEVMGDYGTCTCKYYLGFLKCPGTVVDAGSIIRNMDLNALLYEGSEESEEKEEEEGEGGEEEEGDEDDEDEENEEKGEKDDEDEENEEKGEKEDEDEENEEKDEEDE